ncbi:hypothetical protein E2C01_091278 [Portunus trituberculatus]|uniref:Uncharacterized protein n=1 Tax=Portunus trituberculatus TaxID=210409 RepID=A0A5B7JIQ2_PORTR|nr:hypothetical protein [Portunus trituberculatus]
MQHLFVPFIDNFMLTACLLSSHGIIAQGFLLLPLIPILSNSPIQKLTSFLNHSYLSLVNSGTPCLFLYFHLPTI